MKFGGQDEIIKYFCTKLSAKIKYTRPIKAKNNFFLGVACAPRVPVLPLESYVSYCAHKVRVGQCTKKYADMNYIVEELYW